MLENISREEFINRAWLAGIIDGEGHVTLNHNKARRGYTPQVIITNTDPRLIAKISKIWKPWNIKFFYYLDKRNSGKDYDKTAGTE